LGIYFLLKMTAVGGTHFDEQINKAR
jgi:hypothetical protein